MSIGHMYATCCLTDEEMSRLNLLIQKIGSIERTRRLLGIGESTIDAARLGGRLKPETRARIVQAIAEIDGGPSIPSPKPKPRSRDRGGFWR